MDKPRNPARKRAIRLMKWIMGGAILSLMVIFVCCRDTSSKVNVDVSKLTLATVRQAVFQDYAAVIGVVEPIQVVYLDATEGGRVEEIFLREGARLKQGDSILRLSNENLLLEISRYETEAARAVNDLKSQRVALENQEYDNQAKLIQYQYDLSTLGRDYTNKLRMFEHKIVSEDTYLLSQEDYERKRKQYELHAKKTAQDTVSIAARIAAAEEMVEAMQKSLAAIRARLNKLVIKAPVNGELATLNVQLGQVIAYGARIGTANVLDAYKLKADVDEHYIARVKVGLKAVCDFSAKEYQAVIAKVYPEVSGGKFSVDLMFASDVPAEIRIGQTSRIRLELGESQTALLVPRGGFYQSSGGQWIFAVDRRRGLAVKRPIKLGRQNPDSYEVLDGLKAGDEVISSSYENWGDRDKVVLK